jgi:hypothetical protein
VEVPDPLLAACSVAEGAWRFFDFTAPSCPAHYGFYVALFTGSCRTRDCSQRASGGTYGFLEAREPNGLPFASFKQQVLANAAGVSYASEGVHRYRTTEGVDVDFEINPPWGRSSLAALQGAPYSRDLDDYPLWRGDRLLSSTPGRITIDNPHLQERVILDMSFPQEPQRFHVQRPSLVSMASVGGTGGRHFDDSGDVVPGGSLAWVELRTGERLDRLAYGYTSGLEASHGGMGGRAQRLTLETGEYLASVRISLTPRGDRIGSLFLTTNRGRTLGGGTVRRELQWTAPAGSAIVAFHGQSGKEVDRLGIVTSPLTPTPQSFGRPHP